MELHGRGSLPGPNVDLVLPHELDWSGAISAGTYDVVISSQTMEHVRRPWKWMAELARIAKPGGLIYVWTPHTIHYHPYPINCWRVLPEGMQGVMQDAGLAIVDVYRRGIDTTGIGRKRLRGQADS